MAKKRLPMMAGLPYHVFARSNNKAWFYLPIENLWQIFLDLISRIVDRFGVQIGAFVLMNNHYHMVIVTPNANLGEAMNYLQREVSKKVNRITGRINHVFGGPYAGCLIENTAYLYHVYKYVYRNPVDAGIVTRVEDYEYSTAKVFCKGTFPFTVNDDYLRKLSPIPLSIDARLKWLNEATAQEQIQQIEKGLRRSIFTLPKWRNVLKS